MPIAPDPDKAIEILDFVELKEIDPIYFNKTYYLGAQDENNKAYALLRQSLEEETGKIGVAKVTIRSKQSLAVIRILPVLHCDGDRFFIRMKSGISKEVPNVPTMPK